MLKIKLPLTCHMYLYKDTNTGTVFHESGMLGLL